MTKFFAVLFLSATAAFCQLSVSCAAELQQGESTTCTATGGTEPYTFSLMTGSVGSINSSTGVYTAPASIDPVETLNGCQVYPNNSIYHVDISTLPVHAMSAIWTANALSQYNSLQSSTGPGDNVVNSSDPSTYTPILMSFHYDPSQNGTFLFPPEQFRTSEAGLARYENGFLRGTDNHYVVTYRDNCHQQEVYGMWTQGYATTAISGPDCPAGTGKCNSAAGLVYDMESLQDPGFGTTAGGEKMDPLEITPDEWRAAEAGNTQAIQHPLRTWLNGSGFSASTDVWPAQAMTGEVAKATYTVNVSGTDVTATSGSFNLHWSAGMTVYISGTSCATPTGAQIASVNSTSDLTLQSSCGTATGATLSQPLSNFMPYGSWLRLKSSFNIAWDAGCQADAGCSNLTNALVWTLQHYGALLDDAIFGGGAFGFGAHLTGKIDYSTYLAQLQLNDMTKTGDMGASNLWTNYEVVDQSCLQTNQTYSGTSGTWLEAKLNNTCPGGTVPVNGAAVVQVTDANSATAYYSIALQGVAVGILDPTGQNEPSEVVQAGASPIQFTSYVTGTGDQGVTCSLSPSGGANGTVTTAGLYTPPSTSVVTTRTDTTLTCVSLADPAKSASKSLIILPVDADGLTRIALGKLTATTDAYLDKDGHAWWNDFVKGKPTMWPNLNAYARGCGPGCAGGNYSTAPNLYNQYVLDTIGNDAHLIVWTSTGVHPIALYTFSGPVNQPDTSSFSLDVNGAPVTGLTDAFTFAARQSLVKRIDMTADASQGYIHVGYRNEGVKGACTAGFTSSGCGSNEGIVYSRSGAVEAGALEICLATSPVGILSRRPTPCGRRGGIGGPLN